MLRKRRLKSVYMFRSAWKAKVHWSFCVLTTGSGTPFFSGKCKRLFSVSRTQRESHLPCPSKQQSFTHRKSHLWQNNKNKPHISLISCKQEEAQVVEKCLFFFNNSAIVIAFWSWAKAALLTSVLLSTDEARLFVSRLFFSFLHSFAQCLSISGLSCIWWFHVYCYLTQNREKCHRCFRKFEEKNKWKTFLTNIGRIFSIIMFVIK